MLLSTVIMAFCLDIDSFGIGLTYGIRKIRIPFLSKVIIFFITAVTTCLSVIFGGFLHSIIPDEISKYISSIMIILLALFILFETFFKDKLSRKKSSVPVEIIRKPETGDRDKSKHIDNLEAVYLGFTLAVDSFFVGLGLDFCIENYLVFPLSVGLFHVVFLTIAYRIGSEIKTNQKINQNIFVVICAVILIVIAVLKCI